MGKCRVRLRVYGKFNCPREYFVSRRWLEIMVPEPHHPVCFQCLFVPLSEKRGYFLDLDHCVDPTGREYFLMDGRENFLNSYKKKFRDI